MPTKNEMIESEDVVNKKGERKSMVHTSLFKIKNLEKFLIKTTK